MFSDIGHSFNSVRVVGAEELSACIQKASEAFYQLSSSAAFWYRKIETPNLYGFMEVRYGIPLRRG